MRDRKTLVSDPDPPLRHTALPNQVTLSPQPTKTHTSPHRARASRPARLLGTHASAGQSDNTLTQPKFSSHQNAQNARGRRATALTKAAHHPRNRTPGPLGAEPPARTGPPQPSWNGTLRAESLARNRTPAPLKQDPQPPWSRTLPWPKGGTTPHHRYQPARKALGCPARCSAGQGATSQAAGQAAAPTATFCLRL